MKRVSARTRATAERFSRVAKEHEHEEYSTKITLGLSRERQREKQRRLTGEYRAPCGRTKLGGNSGEAYDPLMELSKLIDPTEFAVARVPAGCQYNSRGVRFPCSAIGLSTIRVIFIFMVSMLMAMFAAMLPYLKESLWLLVMFVVFWPVSFVCQEAMKRSRRFGGVVAQIAAQLDR